MPPLPSPGNILRVTIKQGEDATTVEAGSRFFISYTGAAPGAGDLNTLASSISGAWGTHIASLVASAESLHGVEIVDLSSSTGAEGTWSGTVVGTRTGAPNVASACAVVNHVINRRYRGGRPRSYLRCGVQSDLNNTNDWSTTFQSAVLTGWQAFIAEVLGFSAGTASLTNIVNVSWYEGFTVYTTPSGRARNIPTLRTTPHVDTIVSSVVAIKVGSQRRRNNL